MPKINVLPLSLRNKIAAGEVVERPSSVVKELIENSIDAGSTRITVETSHAGKRLIRVSDNGIGMEREDVLLAFERYATSKISDERDLFHITTMGFRGEALSSIASVAKVRLTTAPRKNNETVLASGTCIELIGGEVKEIKDCPALGTSIEVKDLFFNTPARRKFLKSDTTENYHIIDTVTRAALAHFPIGFILHMDGSEVLHLPAAFALRERLLQVYGKEFIDGLLETESESGQARVKAFFSTPVNLRNNKNNQFLFINGRPVKDQSVAYAVYKAFEGMLPKEKHPIFFIFLELDPSRVDFNVHPAKREVRFENKSSVFELVYQAVSKTLKHGVTEPWSNEKKKDGAGDNAGVMEYWRTEKRTEEVPHYSNASESPLLHCSETSSPFVGPFAESVPFLYLGDTLVAVSDMKGVTVIDYHAAHERINYERFLKKTGIPSYPLLFPQQVKLPQGEYRVVLDHLAMLNDFGLEVDDFGHGTLLVRSLPEPLRDADAAALMSDVAAALLERDRGMGKEGDAHLEPLEVTRKKIAARLACHSSIRGKEVPDGARIAALMKSLDAADNPHTCPHGRPTRVVVSLEELRRMFRK